MIFDLIVIGGGPAGYIGAERAGRQGLTRCLLKNSLGGVCLNRRMHSFKNPPEFSENIRLCQVWRKIWCNGSEG